MGPEPTEPTGPELEVLDVDLHRLAGEPDVTAAPRAPSRIGHLLEHPTPALVEPAHPVVRRREVAAHAVGGLDDGAPARARYRWCTRRARDESLSLLPNSRRSARVKGRSYTLWPSKGWN